MLRNYLKVAIRNIVRRKIYSLINILGLAIGIACCIIILLWVRDELNYDKFHVNGKNIYRLIGQLSTEHGSFDYAKTPNGLGPVLEEMFPEVVYSPRFQSFDGWLVQNGEKFFTNDRLGTADESFFEVFSFPLLKGDPKTALIDRYSVVLTEKMAKKYFSDGEDPIGKIIKIASVDFKVTGVMKDIPYNSHMQFDCIFPIINMESFWSLNLKDWGQFRFVTYVQLRENSFPDALSKKITDLAKDYLPVKKNIRVFFQPLERVHLYSNYRDDEDNVRKGNILYIYIFSLLALWILLVACINSVNLAIALSGNRAKEVGMRKVVGATKKDLIKQFFGESIVLALFAFLIAIFLVFLFLPAFNQLSAKEITFTLDLSENISIVLGIIGIIVFTGIVSGGYPALFLSSFQPAQVLKGMVGKKMRRKPYLQRILVIFQFTIAIILIISIIVVFSQLNYISSKDLGFDNNNVVYYPAQGKFRTNFELVKNELLRNPDILAVTGSWSPIHFSSDEINVQWEGKNTEDTVVLHPFNVDYDFMKFFDMKMSSGRFFSADLSTDISNYVVNETAAVVMGLQSPVGKWLSFRGNKGVIIGVVRDFHQGSLHNRIPPLVLKIANSPSEICVKIMPGKVSGTIDFLKNKWKEFVGQEYPFAYQFLDESISNFYNVERKIGTVLQVFTFLAILVSCLGLFGLSSFMVRQQTKQIGIRKLLGASVSRITMLLTSRFARWVLWANLFAWPVAWFGMNRLLRIYAYRISIGWWMFVMAGLVALTIAVLTVIAQTVKAAQTNPVDVLKFE
ncbi:MAG: MacB protein [Acidobacteriota bacterium]|nr:MacB protein [Acidobacteriota bacterium]